MNKKRFRAIDGLLCLHKEVNQSSNDALQKVRRIFRAEKAGHGGTLDPFASGLLPILFGEATKFSNYFLDADKSYRVCLAFGSETDTQDLTGNITRSASIPKEIDWQALLNKFMGAQKQIPPKFSALKVAGQRAYDLARAGQDFELAAREIEIHELQLLQEFSGGAELLIRCSKGTYIRTLVEDLGRALNSAAHATQLERIAVAGFEDKNLTLDLLANLSEEALLAHLIPLENCLQHLAKIEIPEEKFNFIRNGNDIFIGEKLPNSQEVTLYFAGQFFGIGFYNRQRIYPKRLIKKQ